MFKPVFSISPKIATVLMHLESLKQEISNLPITPAVLASLRETSRLETIHYSTKIEGNCLTEEEVARVIKLEHGSRYSAKSQPPHHKRILIERRERDEQEVLGYYAALDEVERLVRNQVLLTEAIMQKLHALVMGGGKKKVDSTAYRDGQNVIRDGSTGNIVYLPPEAHDVARLMKELVTWINKKVNILPCPLRAGIAHYQYATIHPYYDGNGRTARLITTCILHQGGYDLKGLYSLEEYYAKNLHAYYNALAQGPSHNYYLGRAQADITQWIEYFCLGMVESFENVKRHALQAHTRGRKDTSLELRNLDARQRAALNLFAENALITSHTIEKFFKLKPRTARALCLTWVQDGFLNIADASKKNRKYELAPALYKMFFERS